MVKDLKTLGLAVLMAFNLVTISQSLADTAEVKARSAEELASLDFTNLDRDPCRTAGREVQGAFIDAEAKLGSVQQMVDREVAKLDSTTVANMTEQEAKEQLVVLNATLHDIQNYIPARSSAIQLQASAALVSVATAIATLSIMLSQHCFAGR